MCLAIPMKIMEIDGAQALGEAAGITQRFRIDTLPQVQTGDFVMVHAGFAIEVIDRKEAKRMRALYEEMFYDADDESA